MCLEVSTSIIAPGAPIWQAPCQAEAALQVFKPSGPFTPDTVIIIAVPASRLCLDVRDASLEDAAGIVQWTCDHNFARPSQQWKVVAAR